MIDARDIDLAAEICAYVTDDLTRKYKAAKKRYDDAIKSYEIETRRIEVAFGEAERLFGYDLSELVEEWHHCGSCGGLAHLDGCFDCGISTTTEEKE